MSKYSLIIIADSNAKDVSKKILDKAKETLEAKKKEYKIIDLTKDKFKPEFEGENLALYGRGETKDKNVSRYQELIKGANELIFIYKIKLNAPEVKLKGFLDKVFLKNGFWYSRKVAYFNALWGEMGWIKKSICLTYQDENEAIFKSAKKAAQYQMTRGTLFALKSHGIKMHLLCNAKEEKRHASYISKIGEIVGKV